jgi:uncharacterized protein
MARFAQSFDGVLARMVEDFAGIRLRKRQRRAFLAVDGRALDFGDVVLTEVAVADEVLHKAGERREPAADSGRRSFIDFAHDAFPGDDRAVIHLAQLVVGANADQWVSEIVRRVVETAQPEKIILFGSRARGDARLASDFDVLVIMESSEPSYRRDAPLYAALADLPVEVDVLVYTPERWQSGARFRKLSSPRRRAREKRCMKEKAELVLGWLRKAQSRG